MWFFCGWSICCGGVSRFWCCRCSGSSSEFLRIKCCFFGFVFLGIMWVRFYRIGVVYKVEMVVEVLCGL